MKYYIIPITDIINCDLTIEDLLIANYNQVYKAILDYCISEETQYEKILFSLLNQYNLPFYLVLKEENNRLFEVESNKEISKIGINLLDYETKEENLKSYLDNNYLNSIINLFTGTEKKF